MLGALGVHRLLALPTVLPWHVNGAHEQTNCGSVVSDVWQSDSLYREVTLAELSLHHIHCSASLKGQTFGFEYARESFLTTQRMKVLALFLMPFSFVSVVGQALQVGTLVLHP